MLFVGCSESKFGDSGVSSDAVGQHCCLEVDRKITAVATKSYDLELGAVRVRAVQVGQDL